MAQRTVRITDEQWMQAQTIATQMQELTGIKTTPTTIILSVLDSELKNKAQQIQEVFDKTKKIPS